MHTVSGVFLLFRDFYLISQHIGISARREKRGRQPEKIVVPLPSRAFSHARGHFACLGRFARRTKKKRETARSLNPKGSFLNSFNFPGVRGFTMPCKMTIC